MGGKISIQPFFIGQTSDLSATWRDVVVDGDLQTEVLGMIEKAKKKERKGDRNKNSLSSSRNDV